MNADTIQLAHGGGGRLSRALIVDDILSRFGDGPLRGLPDGAALPRADASLIFSTDSFVVQPVEFAGGNIGDLAVYGTINDIAVSGGRPKWLSLSMILEEGLPLPILRRVLDSVRSAAARCEVAVVTGDTKVVAHGQCDGLYLNTAGIGEALDGFRLAPERIAEGDRVLVSGPIGDHGMAVLAAREEIGIGDGPTSDTGPVLGLVLAAQEWAPDVHFMRDPTRGGLSAVLNEIVEDRDAEIVLTEDDIPLSAGSRAVAELLGLDFLQVACEGRIVLVCGESAAPGILRRWQSMSEGRDAACIGSVTRWGPARQGASTGLSAGGRVVMETVVGGRRLVDMPHGELLPRIC